MLKCVSEEFCSSGVPGLGTRVCSGIVLRTHLAQTAACDSARAVSVPESGDLELGRGKGWVGAREPAKGRLSSCC